MKSLNLILLYFFCSVCLGANQIEFFTDSKTCSVKEVGFVTKNDPIVFPGSRWEAEDYYAGCTVTISRQLFEKSYSMCYLSGVDMYEGGSCAFGLRNTAGTRAYVFEFDAISYAACRFTCVEL